MLCRAGIAFLARQNAENELGGTLKKEVYKINLSSLAMIILSLEVVFMYCYMTQRCFQCLETSPSPIEQKRTAHVSYHSLC